MLATGIIGIGFFIIGWCCGGLSEIYLQRRDRGR